MTYDLAEDGTLSELPMKSIDTGMGLERMAAVLQGVESVFDTDALRPLVDLAEELSGRSYEADQATTRAMRILADHSRGAAAMIADGVVPSNEERGYVLRRIMRRAIHRGRSHRPRGALHGAVRRPRAGHPRPHLPGARGRARHRDAVGERRGGELRPHARSRHADGRGT